MFSKLRSVASATIASAKGCSLPLSAEAARRKISCSSKSSDKLKMSTNCGRPSVSVPVLSKRIVSTPPVASKLSPDLKRIPNSEARPVPVITAVGVARPIAQGQAITKTATVLMIARASELSPLCAEMSTGIGIRYIHNTKVMTATAITMGTKTAEILSASCWMGALLDWASSTNLMI